MQVSLSSLLRSEYKQKILTFIQDFLKEKSISFSLVNSWGIDLNEKLGEFISQGKMIRGSLVLFIYEMYKEELTEEAITLAAALEFFHSSLLIHDDIMDNDMMRRGKQTIFAQYASLAEKEHFSAAYHFGESMGIVVGDIGFFLGLELLSSLNGKKLSILCMQELITVGLAQMQDVYGGYTRNMISEQAIENVYIQKTGRYTFSLPLMLGALLAKQSQSVIGILEQFGEDAGLLFQLRDDYLSILGKEADTGKPEGSDIRENKKTLYRLYLFEKASFEQKQKLETIFGNAQLNNADLDYVRDLMISLGIQKKVETKMKDLRTKTKEKIEKLALSETYRQQLLQLVQYICEREK